jgi:HprK-related kinase B
LSVSSFIQQTRAEQPVEQAVFIRALDTLLEVRCSTSALSRALQDYFEPFLAPAGIPDGTLSLHQALPPHFDDLFQDWQPDSKGKSVKDSFLDCPDGRITRKIKTGLCFAFTDTDNCLVGPCLEHLNQVINAINVCFMRPVMAKGALIGHAAGVAMNGSGLVIAGRSGSGKSTLALHLLSRGASLVSNDRLLFPLATPGPTMCGVPKHPRVNPGTLLDNPDLQNLLQGPERRELDRLSFDQLWGLEKKHDVLIHKVFGANRIRLQAPLRMVLIMGWDHRNQAVMRIDEADPHTDPTLLDPLVKAPGVFLERAAGGSNPASVEEYCSRLQSCRFYRISGGVNFESARRACQELLDTEGSCELFDRPSV